MKLGKILVPLDGSMLAEGALSNVVDLAEKNGATISLLRAAEAFTRPGADAVEAQATAVREAEEYLAAVVRRLANRKWARRNARVVWPRRRRDRRGCSRQKADLVVMSTHGRSGLGRLVLGRVTESVLRGTTVPILVVRADHAPLDAPRGAPQAERASHV